MSSYLQDKIPYGRRCHSRVGSKIFHVLSYPLWLAYRARHLRSGFCALSSVFATKPSLILWPTRWTNCKWAAWTVVARGTNSLTYLFTIDTFYVRLDISFWMAWSLVVVTEYRYYLEWFDMVSCHVILVSIWFTIQVGSFNWFDTRLTWTPSARSSKTSSVAVDISNTKSRTKSGFVSLGGSLVIYGYVTCRTT